MNLIYRLYYAFNRWRYGKGYGCGRCHHGYHFHQPPGQLVCTVSGCPCKGYNIERVNV